MTTTGTTRTRQLIGMAALGRVIALAAIGTISGPAATGPTAARVRATNRHGYPVRHCAHLHAIAARTAV